MNVIDRARERIERDGWWQLASPTNRGRHCVLTALNAVEDECTSGIDAWRAIVAELDVHRTVPLDGAIAKWNDDPSTSLEDVLLVMKRASARLDEAAL